MRCFQSPQPTPRRSESAGHFAIREPAAGPPRRWSQPRHSLGVCAKGLLLAEPPRGTRHPR